MRELLVNEVLEISGGKANDGYNFSYVLSNGLFVGVFCGVLGGSFWAGATFGAGYASLMLVAKAADSYFFPEDQVVVTHTAFVDPSVVNA